MRKLATCTAICAALALGAGCGDKKTDAKTVAKKDGKSDDKAAAKADVKADAKADAKADDPKPDDAAAGGPPFTDAVFVRHEVKDFDAWKAAFDKGHEDRAKGGTVIHWVMRDAENENIVMVTAGVKGLDGVKAMFADPEMKKKMEEGGVVGEPEILMGEIKTMSPPPAKDAPKPAGALFVKHDIADYAQFEKVFLAHGDKRVENGFGAGYGVMALDGSPNTVAIHLDVMDMEKAKAFAASDDLKKAMEEAGVKGPPTMYWSGALVEEKMYDAVVAQK